MDEYITSTSEEVKSRAVVKYSVPPKPASYTKLQCNTDLNLPPSNWLSSSADSYGLQHVLCQRKGFSSFRMAHMFPDCVGEVDVVSDAENIKNLLKIPYHKGQVSMMVHRIENTLLLDDFDIYQHILRTAEAEWEWLRSFFQEHIRSYISDKDKTLYIKNKRRKALQQRNLISKFLYHSLVESDCEMKSQLVNNKAAPMPVNEPALPEPAPAEEVPDPMSQGHTYNRNVVWTFEDIQMLIGTDMPIFGGGTHPCISLRLSDMNKPISVLTGIDYWLDNLMSNVPEVVMCYHLNGIVQKYELIKTEDLPRLDNSKFSPKLIRDVAQSILSFLKSNATKAGHTYWLFKGKDEEVVKLYDLTSLCSQKMDDKDRNPFTVPVAMLLYRVARNMKHSNEGKHPGTIRMLLKNCIKLLSEEKYPQIVTSSHYMLSDLYIPAGINPESPELNLLEDDDTATVYDDDDDDLADDENKDSATKVLVLNSAHDCKAFANYYKPPPPITGSITERCGQAVHNVAAGLACLKYFHQPEDQHNEMPLTEENEVKMAKPFEAIPMPYHRIEEVKNSMVDGTKCFKKQNRKHREKNKKKCGTESIPDTPHALLLKSKTYAQPLPTWQEPADDASWKLHLKTLLYEKATLVYATLIEQHFSIGNFGDCLRYIGLLVRCEEVLNSLFPSNPQNRICILGRAGDCCLMIVKTWNEVKSYREQYKTHLEEDMKMIEELQKDEQLCNIDYMKSNMRCALIYDILTMEQMLLKSTECYEEMLKASDSDSMYRRLGNSLNELGSFYIHQAKTAESESLVLDSCKKAEIYLKRGLEYFDMAKDESNTALLYSNMGTLYRILAFNSSSSEGELTGREKLHYNKAFIYYKKALQVLGDRQLCPGIWDAVTWELCSALYTMGTILQDHPSSGQSRADAEREVLETFHKALKYCDLSEENPKFPFYQVRAADIHSRLGSIYHSHIWNSPIDAPNKKNITQLAKLHYEKSAKLFFLLSDPLNYLSLQMRRLALSEYLVETSAAVHVKIKNLQNCLEIVFGVQPMLQLIVDNKVELSENDIKEVEPNTGNLYSFQNFYSHIIALKHRLQYLLRLVIKVYISKPSTCKNFNELSDMYKSCYILTFKLEGKPNFQELLIIFNSVLLEIKSKVSTSVNT